MIKRETIYLLLIVGLVVWMVRGCFTKAEKTENMIRNEVLLEQLQNEKPKLEKELEKSNARYDSLKSASDQRYQDLENRRQPLKIIYEKIPVIVGNLDKEQLRSGTNDF